MNRLTLTLRNHGITALFVSTATLVILRGFEVLDWHWALVFAPLWLPFLLVFIISIAVGTGRGLDALIDQPYQYRDNGPGGVAEIEQILAASVIPTSQADPTEEPITTPREIEEEPALVTEETLDLPEETAITVQEPTLYARRGNWEAFAVGTPEGKVILLQVRNLSPEVTGKVSATALTARQELQAQASSDGTWEGTFRALAPTVALSAVAGKTIPNIWQPHGDKTSS